MKVLKKFVATALLVGMLSMSLAASAFANTNINEQNDTQNNSPYTPENFIAPLPVGTNPFGYTKLGTLSSTNDQDWYLLELPANTVFPGSTALITLISPYQGSYYSMAIIKEGGGVVEKQWLVDNESMVQVLIKTEPNTKYQIRVYTDAETVSPYNYMLSVN